MFELHRNTNIIVLATEQTGEKITNSDTPKDLQPMDLPMKQTHDQVYEQCACVHRVNVMQKVYESIKRSYE